MLPAANYYHQTKHQTPSKANSLTAKIYKQKKEKTNETLITKSDHIKHPTIDKIHCSNTTYALTCEYSEFTFFSILEEERTAAGNCCARRPSRRFFCKLSSRLFFRISTILSSLLRRPSSASTATLYRFRRTSVLVLGLKDMVD